MYTQQLDPDCWSTAMPLTVHPAVTVTLVLLTCQSGGVSAVFHIERNIRVVLAVASEFEVKIFDAVEVDPPHAI
jgi:hypothetical protein